MALTGNVGARGQQELATTTRDILERFKPYVLGTDTQSGLLGYTQAPAQRQMTPEFAAGADQTRATGLGLLKTPQRGNGFGLFTKGRS